MKYKKTNIQMYIPKMKSKRVFAILLLLLMVFDLFIPPYAGAQSITPAQPDTTSQNSLPETLTNEDYYSNLTTEEQSVNSLADQGQQDSAVFQKPTRLRPFARRDLRADESPTVVVDNAKISNLTFKIFDFEGNEVSANTEIISDQDPVVFKIHPGIQYKPGRYRIKITDNKNKSYIQDFTWGVLAINTTKSIYKVGETASIQMAVLDDTGEMVCDSRMNLKITDPSSNVTEATTEAGTIIVNPQCYSKDMTIIPDYQAVYNVGEEGVYKLELTATTPDGSYTVKDAFEAKGEVAFEIERQTATRIYPPNAYPVTFEIVANQDFEGKIKESVPASFEISKLPSDTVSTSSANVVGYDSIEEKSVASSQEVLGAGIFDIGLPYTGEHEQTLGFGRQHRDSGLSRKYTEFGVLGHDGVDFALPMHTAVIAVDDGEVVRASANSDYGTTIVIQHKWGKSYYGHLDKIIRTTGEKVTRGQTIGLSGNTGLSSGPHLHFGIKPDKNDFDNGYYGKINPLPFLGIADTVPNQGMVAGVSTNISDEKNGIKEITWNVSVKKGEKIKLGYQFNAPMISPELYLLGPLEFKENGSTIFAETRRWQIAADAVVVSGTISASEAQFGGLQRKLAYANGDWYAFFNDGTDVTYSKSANGVTWGAPVDVDGTDADNYNPSIATSNGHIFVFWMDESADLVEGKRLDTSTDTLGTLCQLASPGAYTVSTYMPTVAALSTTAAIVVYSDTNGGTNEGAYEVTGLDGTCAGTALITSNTFGANGQQGHGFGDADRPVAVPLTSTTGGVVYQDGNLSWSMYDATLNEWQNNNQTIASVTDNIYSVTTDGTNIWVLTVDTAQSDETRLYKCCTTDIVETQIDSDAGANDDDGDSDINMFCLDSSNCKIVYTDSIDADPDLVFVDCGSNGAGGRDAAGDDPHCSTNAITVLDSDIGAATDQAGASVYCVASDNCKIATGDDMDTTSPALEMIDCTADHDCSTNGNSGEIDTDLGGATNVLHTSIHCPADTDCKILYNDGGLSDVFFVDCSSETCNTRDVITTVDGTAGAVATLDLDCSPGATDCKFVYHDNSATGGCADANSLCFVECADGGCTDASDTKTVVDSAIGTTTGAAPVSIDCIGNGADCKILYGDTTAGDLFFVDCPDAACTSTGRTITQIDATGGATTSLFYKVSLDCPSATDCKIMYVGETTAGSEDAYFVDCDDATCSTGSVYDLPGPRFGGAVQALTTDDAKMVYYDGTTGTNPTVQFADCDTEDCLPTWSTLTAPFTGATNLISASLTYDSSNSDLYAAVIKDSSELAYWKSSDATSISWGSETDFGFTPAGDLDNISTPHTSAGLCAVGAVLRQAGNLEFNYADSSCIPTGPTLDQTMRHGVWLSNGVEQPFTF